MRTNLALQNIMHNKSRAVLSVAGISVAIILMFMQLGFRGAVENTATTIYEKIDFDLMVRSPNYLYLVLPGQIPRQTLLEISGQEQIESVSPLHVSMADWENPQNSDTRRGVVVLGVDPTSPTFKKESDQVSRDLNRLTNVNSVLIDKKSFPEFGPANGFEFGPDDIGVTTKVSGKPIRIAGLFEMGSGLTANGAMITTENGFDRLVPMDAKHFVSMGLIKLTPGISSQEKQELIARLLNRFRDQNGMAQVEVLTKEEVYERELNRWLGETPIGFVFTLGVIISLIVGAAIVYMVLSTDVASRLGEYATLKAMGYSGTFLGLVVLKQAMYLALFAFVPSLLISLLLYQITAVAAQIPIFMTLARVLFVLTLSFVMSIASGSLAVRKLWQAEPAELF